MPPARRRALTIAWAIAAACLLPSIAHDTLNVWIGPDMPRDVAYSAVFVIATGLCLLRAALIPTERPAWLGRSPICRSSRDVARRALPAPTWS